MMGDAPLHVKNLGAKPVPYTPVFNAMKEFTSNRTKITCDELWICEHESVYTQGLAGKQEHIFSNGEIPIVATDRGGQVTYHGPGQVVAYPLIDLARRGYFVKDYVRKLEETMLQTLADFGVKGQRVAGAPGIYVALPPHLWAQSKNPTAPSRSSLFIGLGKIGALGVKVSRHCTYHGMALNVGMDLAPFKGINPCGYAELETVDLACLGVHVPTDEVANRLSWHVMNTLY